jgi:hypothetical protein
LRLIFVAIVFLLSLPAAELETQHAAEVTSSLGGNWSGTLHFRMRTQPDRAGLYQARLGPIVQYKLTERTNLLAGYYFTNVQPGANASWSTVHRVFGGGERQWHRTGRWIFDTRSVFERYYSKADPEFNRFRQRFRIQGTRPWAPYTAYEFFLDAEGRRGARYIAGVVAPAGAGVRMDFGYFYESRRIAQGGDRHMIMTVIYFRGPGRSTDTQAAH